MGNHLPRKIHGEERGVIKLVYDNDVGTQCVAYKKISSQMVYFDSYGNLPSPSEMIAYLNSSGSSHIQYNY